MGQESSKPERRPGHRKAASSSVAPTKSRVTPELKYNSLRIPNESETDGTETETNLSHRILSHSLSLFATSPPVNSPQFNLMYNLLDFKLISDSSEDLVEETSSASHDETPNPFKASDSGSSKSSETPSLYKFPPKLSVPGLAEDHTSQPPRRPSLPSPQPTPVSAHVSSSASLSSLKRTNGIVSVVDKPKPPSKDIVLIQLDALPKFPSTFTPISSSPENSVLQNSGVSSSNFSFSTLWPRSPVVKTPKLQLTASDELNEHLFYLSSSYQCHIKTSCRLLLRNQFKLASDIKDAETSCTHICTYTSPHLNHLKESHSQLIETMSVLKDEVQNTRFLLRNLFKTIEKINSFFPHNERLGYLKYQDQSQYHNLHQAYRKAMLKGSAPQFTTKSNGTNIIGRRRRESAAVLTLDSVLSDRHRPYSQAESFVDYSYHTAGYVSVDLSRPLSSASKVSFDEFGSSASQRLYDIAVSRPTTSTSYRAYTPTHRTSLPLMHNNSASGSIPGAYHSTSRLEDPGYSKSTHGGTTRPLSPLSRASVNGKNDLESLLLLPSENDSSETSPDTPVLEPCDDINHSPISAPSNFTFKGIFAGVSSKVSR